MWTGENKTKVTLGLQVGEATSQEHQDSMLPRADYRPRKHNQWTQQTLKELEQDQCIKSVRSVCYSSESSLHCFWLMQEPAIAESKRLKTEIKQSLILKCKQEKLTCAKKSKSNIAFLSAVLRMAVVVVFSCISLQISDKVCVFFVNLYRKAWEKWLLWQSSAG